MLHFTFFANILNCPYNIVLYFYQINKEGFGGEISFVNICYQYKILKMVT